MADTDTLYDLSFENGKYRYVCTVGGSAEVLRYDEPWREVTGDKFIMVMADEIEDLRERVQTLTVRIEELDAKLSKAKLEARIAADHFHLAMNDNRRLNTALADAYKRCSDIVYLYTGIPINAKDPTVDHIVKVGRRIIEDIESTAAQQRTVTNPGRG